MNNIILLTMVANHQTTCKVGSQHGDCQRLLFRSSLEVCVWHGLTFSVKHPLRIWAFIGDMQTLNTKLFY